MWKQWTLSVAVTLLFLGIASFRSDATDTVEVDAMGQTVPGTQPDTDRYVDRVTADVTVATLTLPRTASGEVNVARVLDAVESSLSQKITRIRFNDGALTQSEVENLFLSVDYRSNLLRRIGDLLPGDGIGRSVRFHGGVDARVQRKEEGTLGIRIEDTSLAGVNAEQRAQMVRDLYALGFDHVRIRGNDAAGGLVRVELREDKGVLKNGHDGDDDGTKPTLSASDDHGQNERIERIERPALVQRVDRSGSSSSSRTTQSAATPAIAASPDSPTATVTPAAPETIPRTQKAETARPVKENVETAAPPAKAETAVRPEQAEKTVKPETVKRPQIVEKLQIVEKVETVRPEKTEKAETVVRPEKVEKPETVARPEKTEKPEIVTRPEKIEKPEKITRPEKVERVDRPDSSAKK